MSGAQAARAQRAETAENRNRIRNNRRAELSGKAVPANKVRRRKFYDYSLLFSVIFIFLEVKSRFSSKKSPIMGISSSTIC